MMRPEAARLTVERCLKNATAAIDAREIAQRCELPLQQVKNHLSNACKFKRAKNVGTPKQGLYLWNHERKIEPVIAPAMSVFEFAVYTGERPAPMRPGAEDFLQCGSVEHGRSVERKRPALISAANAPSRFV